jgi:hypothetical protein
MTRVNPDPWRLDEWHALSNVYCMFFGCEYADIDQRGPVVLRDGSMHKACTEHWEAIHRILGLQAPSNDEMRSGPHD